MNYMLKYDLMQSLSSGHSGHKRPHLRHGHHFRQLSNVRSRSMKTDSVLAPGIMGSLKAHRRTNSFSPSHSEGYSMSKLEEMNLCMQVMDYDRFSRDDPIGEILLPMKNVKLDNSPVYWKNLQKPIAKFHETATDQHLANCTIIGGSKLANPPELPFHQDGKGEIMMSLCYTPQNGKLTVVVIKARDLPAKDITGTSDPYVKLWLIEQGTKVEKRKTSVKPHTLQPVFNESFVFTVTTEKIEHDIQLAITAMDYDILSSNDEMGHIIVGARGSESGQKHWKEMIANNGSPVPMWHRLSPKW